MTDDDDRQRLLQQAAERLRALGPLDDVEAGAGAHLALELTVAAEPMRITR